LPLDVIYNERIKLFATFVNGLGIAIFAVGGLAPLISSLNGSASPRQLLLFTSATCILGAFALHYIASAVLKRIRS